MGLFSSKEHLFNDLEVYEVDRVFLNLHNQIKKFKFDYRGRHVIDGPSSVSGKYGEDLTYDFIIDNRRVRFDCTKHIHKNFEIYKDYFYENRDAPESLESYIGLPNLDDMLKAKSLYPFKTLEMGSEAYIKEKKRLPRAVQTSKTKYLWILYDDKSMWDKKLVKDFDKTAKNLIKETLKNLSKLKKYQPFK